MIDIETNPFLGRGLMPDGPHPVSDASRVSRLLAACPAHGETPLTPCPGLAADAGVQALWLKDERQRMGLGSFKALGASFALALEASLSAPDDWSTALAGRRFITASAGNHGLSVAAGARVFGAKAIIYIAETVPEPFAVRLRGIGATVMRAGADYEASMAAAEQAAADGDGDLLSDSTWTGCLEPGMRVMEGYLQMAAEAAQQIPEPPTHILLQAGVGGMAAAIAAYARRVWGDQPEIIVVEPTFAPALKASIRAGGLITSDGPVSAMGRLDCKTPSLVALAGLSRDANRFATISEDAAAAGVRALHAQGFATTPSGGAGVAALLSGLDLGQGAVVLAFLSEGPEDG